MKPESEHESGRRLQADLDYAMIDAGMAEARRLRAEAMASALLALWRAPGAAADWLRSARPVAPAPTNPAQRIRSALAALRASAEILRDHPEISAAERRRLVEIVLAEEARLERLTGARKGPEKA